MNNEPGTPHANDFGKTKMLDELIRPDQLAKTLGVAQGTIYLWVKQGKIPHFKLGKSVRFDPADIKKWLKENKQEKRPASKF